jgi:hypothetical protein
MLRSLSHPQTFEERLAEYKVRLVQKASKLKPGPERDDLLKRATLSRISMWLISPDLAS